MSSVNYLKQAICKEIKDILESKGINSSEAVRMTQIVGVSQMGRITRGEIDQVKLDTLLVILEKFGGQFSITFSRRQSAVAVYSPPEEKVFVIKGGNPDFEELRSDIRERIRDRLRDSVMSAGEWSLVTGRHRRTFQAALSEHNDKVSLSTYAHTFAKMGGSFKITLEQPSGKVFPTVVYSHDEERTTTTIIDQIAQCESIRGLLYTEVSRRYPIKHNLLYKMFRYQHLKTKLQTALDAASRLGMTVKISVH